MGMEKTDIGRVIITGASGFIGYSLVEKYLEAGYEVYAVVRENTSKMLGLKNESLTVVRCSLENIPDLEDKISARGFDAFIHMAWQGVAGCQACDLDIQLSNVRHACNAVTVADKLGCEKFIFAASIMEYEMMKLMETEIPAGLRNIYRTAKISAHYLTRIMANELKIKYNAVVISNVYGRGDVSDRFINSTLRKMLRGERVKFTKATQLYDFVYIDDAVKMIMGVTAAGTDNKNYYVGNMEPRMLKEYILDMRDCVDRNLELGFGESSEYVGVSLDYDEFDIRAVYSDLEIKPQYSFTEGVKRTIEWIEGNA